MVRTRALPKKSQVTARTQRVLFTSPIFSIPAGRPLKLPESETDDSDPDRAASISFPPKAQNNKNGESALL